MDLFAITCTTCRSRLRVRDPAAVGQILACPKCGGMVMVKPPPVWDEAAQQRADPATAADVEGPRPQYNRTPANSAFDMLEELLSDAPPKVHTPSAPHSAAPSAPNPMDSNAGAAAGQSAAATPKPRFVGGPPVRRSSTPPPEAARSNGVAVPTGAIPPPVKSANAAPSPAAGASTERTRRLQTPQQKTGAPPISAPPTASPPTTPAHAVVPATDSSGRRQWMLMAVSIGMGALLAFTAVTAAIHFWHPADIGRPIPPRPAKKNGTAAETEIPSPLVQPSTVPETATTPVEPTETTTAPIASAPTLTPTDPNASTTSASPSPAPTSPPQLTQEPPTRPATTTIDPLARFDKIFGGPAADPLENLAPRASPPPAQLSADTTDTAPPKPVAPRPPARDVDVAKRLADPLPAIETISTGTPLAEFLQLMSDLTTIPITLDVPFIPATADSAVSLKLANTTVGSAIKEALSPWRLEYIVLDNNQLVVRRAERENPAAFTLPVKTLTDGDAQKMADLAELVQAVVDPPAWSEGNAADNIKIDAAKAALVVTHRRAVQFEVLLALEKLRAARKPPLKHESNLHPSFFQLDSRSSLAKTRLQKPLSLNFSQPTRLLTILERLGGEAGVRILVDWRDAASLGWNPAAEAKLVVSNQPLGAALDALLTPLDLAWRVIDGQTIQVVSPARLAEQGELEFYSIEELVSREGAAEALITRLRTALGDAAFISGGGNGEIRFEENSKCLLAWLPQTKQRELESLLATWRDAK